MRAIPGTITEYGIESQLTVTTPDEAVELGTIPAPLPPKAYVLGYFDHAGNPQLITKGFDTFEEAHGYNERWYGKDGGSAFSVFHLSKQ
jgi:hypothetical protein